MHRLFPVLASAHWLRVFLFVALLGLGGSLGHDAWAQARLDLSGAQRYSQSLDQNFWEEAWIDHLVDRADSDGTINWYYKDRRELSTLTDDYQMAIGKDSGFWTTLHVDDYLQRQLKTVQPNPMMPGRPGAFRLRVLSTTTPNALALNDGTILVTTGLLTTLETEAQVQAILAHEVAHIVLDHALATYRAGKKRSRARKLLGSIISGVTSVVSPGFGRRGSLESTVYGLSTDAATRYLDRDFIAAAGLSYNRPQEDAANRLAREWLQTHDRSPEALPTALQALHQAGTYGSVSHAASFIDNHPYTPERGAEAGEGTDPDAGAPAVPPAPATTTDSVYDAKLAAVFEHEAEMHLASRRFHGARTVLDRALRTSWTTPETFLFQAIAVRNTTTGSDGIADALVLLNKAEAATTTPDPRIEAERALLRIRQGNVSQARQHLSRCREQIDGLREASPNGSDSTTTHAALRTWTSNMELRLSE